MFLTEVGAVLSPFKNLLFLTGVLIGPAFLAYLCRQANIGRAIMPQFWGRVGIAHFLMMTASAHFSDPAAMASMLPEILPLRVEIVVLTGVLEIALGLAVLVPKVQRLAGLAIMAMLLGFLPANVYAALIYAPFGGAEMGPAYLLVRVPYQAVLIGFVFWASQTGPRQVKRLGQAIV
ncbi:DoxX family protein [Maritalea sp. S77]|uniref:DoxX family protein n=1 Tax=Maritalea sp. S77 TaxID=3415125 RepID=UPI003C7E51AB